VKIAFCVSPVRHVATASMKVRKPKAAWKGTSDARQPAVDDSQHSSTRNEKKPTTNCAQQCVSEGKEGEASPHHHQ